MSGKAESGASPSGVDAAARPSPHPAGLLDEEKHFIARWGKREAGLVALFCGAFLISGLLAASHPFAWTVLALPVLVGGGLGILFFRNPRRTIPGLPGAFVAPADGRVVEVGRVQETEFIQGEASKVGIFLSIFDVHLNRAPCSGRVEYLRRRAGKFLDARNPDSSRENESQAIGIIRGESGGPQGVKVLVRQVAGAIARRIVCPLEGGQEVERGRLIGMIKFGSRTELYVEDRPGGPTLEVLVKPGDKVRAGETLIFQYREAGSPAKMGESIS